jgi:hypothetical protein
MIHKCELGFQYVGADTVAKQKGEEGGGEDESEEEVEGSEHQSDQ